MKFINFYPTALSRGQIKRETSTNVSQYLNRRKKGLHFSSGRLSSSDCVKLKKMFKVKFSGKKFDNKYFIRNVSVKDCCTFYLVLPTLEVK